MISLCNNFEKDFEEIMEKYDINKDGVLSFSELKVVLNDFIEEEMRN